MKIAQAEGKEWKKEVHKYLVAYRSTPHTTTGVSPAGLLFGRNMCTKLPKLKEEGSESEMRDRDSEMKTKTQTVCRQEEEYPGVLPSSRRSSVSKTRVKKTTSEPYDVMTKTGNSVVVEPPDGVQLMRNTTHVKKYEETSQNPGEKTSFVDVADTAKPEAKREEWRSPVVTRSMRVREPPERFKDFVMT